MPRLLLPRPSRAGASIPSLAILALVISLTLYARPAHAATSYTFIVTSTADVGDTTPNDGICDTPPASAAHGACTFRAAANEAASLLPIGTHVTIQLPAGTFLLPMGTVYLQQSYINVVGAGPDKTIIKNTKPNNRVLYNLTTSSMLDLTITGGNAPVGGNGGGIYDYKGPLALTHVTLTGNRATQLDAGNGGALGGGLYAAGPAAVTITDSTFSNNTAARGGGLYADSGSFVLTHDLFTGNSAIGGADSTYSVEGGALYDNASSMTITNSTFNGNGEPLVGSSPSGSRGGAIYIQTQATIIGGAITNNRAPGTSGDGGGLYGSGGLDMQGTSVSGNTAGKYGGGIYADYGGSLTGLFITSNIAGSSSNPGQGGGLYVNYPITVTNTVIRFNQAQGGTSPSPSKGGGVYNNDNASYTNVRILQNRADKGGGMYENRDAVTFQDSQVFTNTARVDGGGIYENNNSTDTTANIILNRSMVINNTAGHDGGGFFSNTIPAYAIILNDGSAIVGNHAGDMCANTAPC